MSIAIPVIRTWDIADSLEIHGSVKRGYLGIPSQNASISSNQQDTLGREQLAGLLMVWAEEGSPADQGGLLVGDILVGLNSDPVSDAEEFQVQLSGEIVAQPTSEEVLRGGQPTTITVTIGERN